MSSKCARVNLDFYAAASVCSITQCTAVETCQYCLNWIEFQLCFYIFSGISQYASYRNVYWYNRLWPTYHHAYRFMNSSWVLSPTQQQWLRLHVVCSPVCSEAATNDEKSMMFSFSCLVTVTFYFSLYPPMSSSVSSPLSWHIHLITRHFVLFPQDSLMWLAHMNQLMLQSAMMPFCHATWSLQLMWRPERWSGDTIKLLCTSINIAVMIQFFRMRASEVELLSSKMRWPEETFHWSWPTLRNRMQENTCALFPIWKVRSRKATLLSL